MSLLLRASLTQNLLIALLLGLCGAEDNDALSDGICAGNRLHRKDPFQDIDTNIPIESISETHNDDQFTTVCWIELLTINEYKNGTRYAYKEYSIVLETPADIPQARIGDDPHLEEYEIFNEKTKKSGVFNFSTVLKNGDVTVKKHRSFLCGSGETFTKTYLNLPDKKVIEIKVSPKNVNYNNKLVAIPSKFQRENPAIGEDLKERLNPVEEDQTLFETSSVAPKQPEVSRVASTESLKDFLKEPDVSIVASKFNEPPEDSFKPNVYRVASTESPEDFYKKPDVYEVSSKFKESPEDSSKEPNVSNVASTESPEDFYKELQISEVSSKFKESPEDYFKDGDVFKVASSESPESFYKEPEVSKVGSKFTGSFEDYYNEPHAAEVASEIKKSPEDYYNEPQLVRVASEFKELPEDYYVYPEANPTVAEVLEATPEPTKDDALVLKAQNQFLQPNVERNSQCLSVSPDHVDSSEDQSVDKESNLKFRPLDKVEETRNGDELIKVKPTEVEVEKQRISLLPDGDQIEEQTESVENVDTIDQKVKQSFTLHPENINIKSHHEIDGFPIEILQHEGEGFDEYNKKVLSDLLASQVDPNFEDHHQKYSLDGKKGVWEFSAPSSSKDQIASQPWLKYHLNLGGDKNWIWEYLKDKMHLEPEQIKIETKKQIEGKQPKLRLNEREGTDNFGDEDTNLNNPNQNYPVGSTGDKKGVWEFSGTSNSEDQRVFRPRLKFQINADGDRNLLWEYLMNKTGLEPQQREIENEKENEDRQPNLQLNGRENTENFGDGSLNFNDHLPVESTDNKKGGWEFFLPSTSEYQTNSQPRLKFQITGDGGKKTFWEYLKEKAQVEPSLPQEEKIGDQIIESKQPKLRFNEKESTENFGNEDGSPHSWEIWTPSKHSDLDISTNVKTSPDNTPNCPNRKFIFKILMDIAENENELKNIIEKTAEYNEEDLDNEDTNNDNIKNELTEILQKLARHLYKSAKISPREDCLRDLNRGAISGDYEEIGVTSDPPLNKIKNFSTKLKNEKNSSPFIVNRNYDIERVSGEIKARSGPEETAETESAARYARLIEELRNLFNKSQ